MGSVKYNFLKLNLTMLKNQTNSEKFVIGLKKTFLHLSSDL